MAQLKAGLVGIGGAGSGHLRIASSSDKVEVVAVCDVRKELVDETVSKLGIRGFYNYEDLFKYSEVEVVVMALPHYLYLDAVTKAAEHGLHILKEKPFALNAEEGEKMIRTAEKNDVILMVVSQRRYTPTFRRAKELLDQKAFGDIYIARGVITYNALYKVPDWGWRSWRKYSGGVALLDAGWHIMDLLYWYFGLPRSIYCVLGTKKTRPYATYDTDDKAIVAMEYPDGSVGYALSCFTTLPTESKVLAYGTEGTLEVDGNRLIRYMQDGWTVEDKLASTVDVGKTQFEHFVDCVKRKIEPLTSGRNVLCVQKMIDAGYKSANEGRPIALQASQ